MQKRLTILLNLTLSLILSSCEANEIPKCPDCKVWQANSAAEGILRLQESAVVYCSDAEFDNFKCMSDEALSAFFDTYVNGCKEWRPEFLKNFEGMKNGF